MCVFDVASEFGNYAHCLNQRLQQQEVSGMQVFGLRSNKGTQLNF